jgi:hypothetical protein
MPTYEFISPAGEKFEVSTPTGVSESQARSFFQQQLSSGSLTNLPVGGTLDALAQANQGLTSAISGATARLSTLSSSLKQIQNIPPVNGINAANFVKVPVDPKALGNLDSSQVKGLIAQAQALTSQGFDVISPKGIGGYGLTPDQLEQQGFLKPGTVESYLKGGANVAQVLNSPAVWTGKSGVSGLSNLLADPGKQASVLSGTLSSSLGQLQKLGVLNSSQSGTAQAALLQQAGKFGVDNVVAWSKGSAPAALLPDMNKVARMGEYAASFVKDKLPSAVKGDSVAAGFSKTVNRKTVDQAVNSILGSDKIPKPQYQTTDAQPAPVSPAVTADQFLEATQAAVTAQKNYERVLVANGGDRSSSAVESAYAELRAALARAAALEKKLGI